tara:strand:- start:4381 stop:5223 length:843 start_codon:yes stop_codon:yes gene_type:complete
MTAQNYFTFPNIDPILFSLGEFNLFGFTIEPAVRWYGLMYLLGLLIGLLLLNRVADRSNGVWTREQVSDIAFQGFISAVLGGRIGYVIFYQFDRFIEDPAYLFAIQNGGMSFHGGLIGVLVAMLWYAKTHNRKYLAVIDLIAPYVPIGLGLGRIGNFINGELWGRTTDVPWAMIFPHVDNLPRHPSQLYQFALEGVFLFILLQWYKNKTTKVGSVSGMFMIGYGLSRIIVETVREPDAHIGLHFNLFTHGQLLCIPMMLLGLYFIIRPHHAHLKNAKIKS